MNNKSAVRAGKPRPLRKPISRLVQAQVLRRDGGLGRWCRRPVIFAPAMKLLTRHMRDSDHTGPLAYYDEHYRRDAAPLLDELAAVIDHIQAYSRGGHDSVENFATACNKCNMRKSDRESRVLPSPRRIKAKYGEPAHWDGFSELFLVLGHQFPSLLTIADHDWRKALLESREQRREGQEAGTGATHDG